MSDEMKSPTEGPNLPQVESPSRLQGPLKYSVDPLDPPSDEDEIDEEEYADEFEVEEQHDFRP